MLSQGGTPIYGLCTRVAAVMASRIKAIVASNSKQPGSSNNHSLTLDRSCAFWLVVPPTAGWWSIPGRSHASA